MMRDHLSGRDAKAALKKQKRIEEITRVVALVIAFVSVFVFLIKLLFL